MAIFVPGLICPICKRAMAASEALVGFSPFVANPADALFMFSDAIFHRACVEQHPLGKEASTWYERTRQTKPADGLCEVCHQRIHDPDDYFGIGLLARDEQDPLCAFNFIHLHRSHLARWPRLLEFVHAMQAADDAGRWRGAKLIFDPARPESLDFVARPQTE